MGDFRGHFGNGVMVIILSLWQMGNGFQRYFAAKRSGQPPFVNAICFPATKRRIPIDMIIFCVVMFLNMVGELEMMFQKETSADQARNLFHLTYVAGYFLFAVVALMDNCGAIRSPLPTTHMALSLAMGIQAFVLYFHLEDHGENLLDVRSHTFIVSLLVSMIVLCSLEMNQPRVQFAIGRCYLFLVSGMFLIQFAFILYPAGGGSNPNWDPDSHSDVMCLTLLFVMHAILGLIVVVAIGVVFERKYDAVPTTNKLTTRCYGQSSPLASGEMSA